MVDLILGTHCIRAALSKFTLRNRLHALLVYKQANSEADSELVKKARDLNIPILYSTRQELDSLAKGSVHQNHILKADTLKKNIITDLRPENQNDLVLCLPQISDPQNFGAIARTAYFMGIKKIITQTPLLTPSSIRASSGALEILPVFQFKGPLSEFLSRCKQSEWEIIGASCDQNATDISTLKPSNNPCMLVMGSEGKGLNNSLPFSQIVRIPGGDHLIDSLNVSVATGVILYELCKIRRL